MNKSKYADNIVFNENNQEFDAYKKKYPTSIGSQKFEEIKIDKSSAKSAQNYFSSRLSELQYEYNKLLDEYKWTKLIYEADYNFQPIIGHKYHLYERENKTLWLSLVSPENWNHKYIGSFKLLNSGKWVKIK